MLLTTRILLSLREHGPAVVELIDACSVHRPALLRTLLERCPVDDGLLAPEKLALAISNHGRLHRGEAGWEWYERWCERHDEAAFVDAVVSYCAADFLEAAPMPVRRAI